MKFEWNETIDGTVIIDCQNMKRLVINDQNFKKVVITKECSIKALALVDMPNLKVVECQKFVEKLYLKGNAELEAVVGNGYAVHFLNCSINECTISGIWEHCYFFSKSKKLNAINIINLYIKTIWKDQLIEVGNKYPFYFRDYVSKIIEVHSFLYYDITIDNCFDHRKLVKSSEIKLNKVAFDSSNSTQLIESLISGDDAAYLTFYRWIFQRHSKADYKKDLLLILEILTNLSIHKWNVEKVIEITEKLKKILYDKRFFSYREKSFEICKNHFLNASQKLLIADYKFMFATYCNNSTAELYQRLNNAENECEFIKNMLTNINNIEVLTKLINKNLIPVDFMMKKIKYLSENNDPFFKAILEFIKDDSLNYKHLTENETFSIDCWPDAEDYFRHRRPVYFLEDLISIFSLYKVNIRCRTAIAMICAKLPSDSKIRKEGMKMILKK